MHFSSLQPPYVCPVHLHLAGLFICALIVQSKAQDQVESGEEMVVYVLYFSIIKVFAALMQKDVSMHGLLKPRGKARVQRMEQATTLCSRAADLDPTCNC